MERTNGKLPNSSPSLYLATIVSATLRSLLFIPVSANLYFVHVGLTLFVFGISGYINVFFLSIKEKLTSELAGESRNPTAVRLFVF